MIPALAVLEAAYYCRLNGKQNAINVMHYRVAADIPDPATMEDVANALSTWVAGAYKAMLEQGCSYDGLKLRIPGPGGTAAVISRNGAGVGTVIGMGNSPTQLCVVASLRASTAPAKVRSRQYYGGFSNQDVSIVGAPTAGLITRVNAVLDKTAINPLVLSILGTNRTFIPVVYRRGTGASYPITSRIVRADFGTQRRRSQINRGDAAM